ncbi:hypothetical protein HDV04_001496 [Boothiomyces sp. JEL0838]|nr:hypothetical protein HDV04_001496 [Boothiomyces sp. JEL0838]
MERNGSLQVSTQAAMKKLVVVNSVLVLSDWLSFVLYVYVVFHTTEEFEHSIYFYSLLHLCTTTTAVHMVGSIAVFELLKVFTFSDKKKVAFQPGPKPVMEIESEKTQQFLHKSDYSEKTIKTIE